jgi:HlyD family secretion protein
MLGVGNAAAGLRGAWHPGLRFAHAGAHREWIPSPSRGHGASVSAVSARETQQTQQAQQASPVATTAATPTGGKRRLNQRRHPRRWLPWLGALVLGGVIAAGLWPRPIAVETATVAVGPLRATVNEEGKTRIKQRYTVAAPVAGQLRRIPYKAGFEIRAGETVLAVIDPLAPAMLDMRSRALAQARQDVAAANLERAAAQHQFAQLERRRAERLAAEKTLSTQDLENAQWRETSAAKEKNAAESALRQAEAELAEFGLDPAASTSNPRMPVEVKAPVSGRVLRVVEESARPVIAGAPLVELGDPADLEVVIEVLSRDGAAIRPGARTELEHWGGGPPLEAVVRLVEPAGFTKISALGVEEQRVNVVADILTPPNQRASLGDAFRVEARIVVWEADRALNAPSGALFRRGQQWAAFVIRAGRAQLRRVEPGRSSGAEVQILGGLEEGDSVILYPGDRIREAQRVRPITL